MTASEPSSTTVPLQTFDLRDGLVESHLEQSAVDAFAADFQALRHFGEKFGNSLDLGAPWMGCLQEQSYTLAFSTPEPGLNTNPRGKGARVGQLALLSEMLEVMVASES